MRSHNICLAIIAHASASARAWWIFLCDDLLYCYFEPVDIEPTRIVDGFASSTEEANLCACPESFFRLEDVTGFAPMLAVQRGIELSLLVVVHGEAQVRPFI